MCGTNFSASYSFIPSTNTTNEIVIVSLAILAGIYNKNDKSQGGKSVKFFNAIRRSMKSPDYPNQLGAF